MTRPLCGLPAGQVPQEAGGQKWRPGPCEHCLEVFGGTTPGEKVVKHGPGVPKELLKATEQLGGLPISQLLRVEELL